MSHFRVESADQNALNAKPGANKRGRPRLFAHPLIQLLLVLKIQYRLAYRALECFSRSILPLLQACVSLPTYSLICKRASALEAIFRNPVQSGVLWKDIEALLKSLGAEISEGSGSRVRFALNGVRAVFHRPHPRKETDKGALCDMRRFLITAGVKP